MIIWFKILHIIRSWGISKCLPIGMKPIGLYESFNGCAFETKLLRNLIIWSYLTSKTESIFQFPVRLFVLTVSLQLFSCCFAFRYLRQARPDLNEGFLYVHRKTCNTGIDSVRGDQLAWCMFSHRYIDSRYAGIQLI